MGLHEGSHLGTGYCPVATLSQDKSTLALGALYLTRTRVCQDEYIITLENNSFTLRSSHKDTSTIMN